MLNYIYMDNLPIWVYLFYFICGYWLNLSSHKIGLARFPIKTFLLRVWAILYFFSNIFLLGMLTLVKMHVGLYFLISIVIPYAVLWRSFPEENLSKDES